MKSEMKTKPYVIIGGSMMVFVGVLGFAMKLLEQYDFSERLALILLFIDHICMFQDSIGVLCGMECGVLSRL